jgi:aspartyl-tRNA synthetase
MTAPTELAPLPDGSPLLGRLRSAWCGELRPAHAGTEVALCGWVAGHRDLGGLAFVDLRDRSGIVQVVLDPDESSALEASRHLRAEFCVRVVGSVQPREGAPNPDLPTGEIEVRARQLEVLSDSAVPPFVVGEAETASEELRLKHRFLDLRRSRMQRILALRHAAVLAGRRHLAEAGLLEIETPILFKSTPEGARDYLVPSRVHPGEFYALPQSPQILKQVLMISGFDGYFQMARCFRDEDLRANRQPEFTQMDLEISFCTEDDVFALTEGYVAALWREGGHAIETPFPRMPYSEAIERYGSDKPDLRFGLEMRDVTDLLHSSGFGVVAGARDRGEVVRGLAVPEGASLSRKEIDGLTAVARAHGAKGLAWIKATGEGEPPFSGPPVKFLASGELEALGDALEASAGSLLLLVVGPPRTSAEALGAVRLAVADAKGLRESGSFRFAWITEFPLYERDEASGELAPAHHPFCMPHEDDLELLRSDPARVRARSYDLVCNGEELGSGSIRIHRRDVQALVFERLGLSEEEARTKFGFFLDALTYGAPPHGGLALGLDRMIMLIAGTDSIRDVIPFPKTASATDLMADCPSPVTEAQLGELRLRVRPVPESD